MNGFNFDSIFHLRGRHPELANDTKFRTWLGKHGVSTWHDTQSTKDGDQTVVVQSRDRRHIFAANLRVEQSNQEIQETVKQVTDFDIATSLTAMSDLTALRLLHRTSSLTGVTVQSSRPSIDFSQNPPTLNWEIEILEKGTVKVYRATFRNEIELLQSYVPNLPQSEGRRASTRSESGYDPLESNELHHLSQYSSLAQQWTQGATTTDEKARKIWTNTQLKMNYDGNITDIGAFTWADSLIIDQLKWRGICDEYAVVQVTMLRAVNIPAVLKFLIWTSGGNTVGHAVVEFQDGSNWRHMDALWRTIDNRAVYRQQGGAQGVTVMDASFPRDSRSSSDAWGVPDPTGDLKLHPYGDYLIYPNYPGDRRPGYSY